MCGRSSLPILLIDDDWDSREIYRAILERVGFHVLEASTAEEGLHLACATQPALIVAEFPLPVSGYPSLAEALRAHASTADVPIVTVTTRALSTFREWALRAGTIRYLTKPLSPCCLLSEVNDLTSGGAIPLHASA
jgi:CheY-like chemotaxis protein